MNLHRQLCSKLRIFSAEPGNLGFLRVVHDRPVSHAVPVAHRVNGGDAFRVFEDVAVAVPDFGRGAAKAVECFCHEEDGILSERRGKARTVTQP